MYVQICVLQQPNYSFLFLFVVVVFQNKPKYCCFVAHLQNMCRLRIYIYMCLCIYIFMLMLYALIHMCILVLIHIHLFKVHFIQSKFLKGKRCYERSRPSYINYQSYIKYFQYYILCLEFNQKREARLKRKPYFCYFMEFLH